MSDFVSSHDRQTDGWLRCPDRGPGVSAGTRLKYARHLRRGAAFALAMALVIPAAPADAQRRNPSMIRDAEIESLLRDYAQPIFGAAGIGSSGAEIVILQDRAFNAFVASGSRIFINTGALLDADTPNEVIGVIAHETGHLAGGHLQGLRNAVARAQAIGAIASLLGAGAAVAGTAAGSSSGAQAGIAATTIGPGVAMRSLLSYRRVQETAADRAALTYLNASGQSARGMIKTFQKFADQTLLSRQYVDPYVVSHPMPNDRISQLETIASRSKYWNDVDSPRLQARHDLMRAKLSAFTESPGRVQRRFPRSDKSLAAEYARAIVAYRTGSIGNSVKVIDKLISQAPNYPYFYELKGQALLENGRPREAVAPLRKAISLSKDNGLIRILLGHALLETGDKSALNEAIQNLKTGLNAEPLASIGYRHLATAYAQQDRIADAELATARGFFIEGQISTAQNYAKRAQAKLKRGSPGWLQADDIITYVPPKPRR